MQNYQKGTRVYTSYSSADVLEWLYVGAEEGIHRVVLNRSEDQTQTSSPRVISALEFENMWSADPQEALAKRLRANILDIEETIKQLTDKVKDTESYIEYKKRTLSDMLSTNKDIISKFPEMFL